MRASPRASIHLQLKRSARTYAHQGRSSATRIIEKWGPK